jgi:hypothetical protein
LRKFGASGAGRGWLSASAVVFRDGAVGHRDVIRMRAIAQGYRDATPLCLGIIVNSINFRGAGWVFEPPGSTPSQSRKRCGLIGRP